MSANTDPEMGRRLMRQSGYVETWVPPGHVNNYPAFTLPGWFEPIHFDPSLGENRVVDRRYEELLKRVEELERKLEEMGEHGG